ncbi:MAG TPA: hypothetical protein VJR71_00715 [Pseudolabrys sp.]|nr:hypothetical protein [Pseudolabrys sp.]
MRKLLFAAVALGILTPPSFAQKRDDDPLVILDREKKAQADQVDRQYKRTLEQTRKDSAAAAAANDPWANMRAPTDGKR